jgi:hypothetical protein
MLEEIPKPSRLGETKGRRRYAGAASKIHKINLLPRPIRHSSPTSPTSPTTRRFGLPQNLERSRIGKFEPEVDVKLSWYYTCSIRCQ